MHRPCCHTANTYDVAAALFVTLLRPTRPPHTLPALTDGWAKRRKSTAASHKHEDAGQKAWKARLRAIEIHEYEQRQAAGSLARLPTNSTQLDKDGVDRAPENTANASRLAYFESLVGASSVEEVLEAQERAFNAPRNYKDAHGIDHVSASGWTKHMGRLAERVRELSAGAKEEDLVRESGVPTKLDYQAFAVDPERSQAETPSPLPWLVPLSERQGLSSVQLLDKEITHFALHMALTDRERAARQYVVTHVYQRIYSLFRGSLSPYVFGSYKTGTALPMSDIDIGVYETNPTERRTPRALEKRMSQLQEELKKHPDYICVVFRGGLFPIITAQHKESGIDVQIVASNGSKPQQSAITPRLELHPSLRPLNAVMRTALGIRGFVDPYIGGISAYATFMLLCAFTTTRWTAAEVQRGSPATQLLHFLRSFANFDTTTSGLNLTEDMPFRKHGHIPKPGMSGQGLESEEQPQNLPENSPQQRKRDASSILGKIKPGQPYLLCLQDPARDTNDLGGRVHAIKHIQLTIKYLSLELQQLAQGHDKGKFANDDAFSLLVPMVGRCHEVYAARRQRVEEFGEKIAVRKAQREAQRTKRWKAEARAERMERERKKGELEGAAQREEESKRERVRVDLYEKDHREGWGDGV